MSLRPGYSFRISFAPCSLCICAACPFKPWIMTTLPFPPSCSAMNFIAILPDSKSLEPTKAVGAILVAELTFTIGILAARALVTAGEQASYSLGFKIITSTFCAIKLSICSICFNGERSASTIINSAPNSWAFFCISSLMFTMNSFCILSMDTPIIILFALLFSLLVDELHPANSVVNVIKIR